MKQVAALFSMSLAVQTHGTLPSIWWWMFAKAAPEPAPEFGLGSTPDRASDASQPPDEFIERLKQRQEHALREMFARYSRGVERVLLRVLGPDPDLSDVVQDSFEQALRSLDRFTGDSDDLRAWLNRIAINVASNRLRHQRVRRWLRGAVPYETSEIASRVASPQVVLAMRRLYEVLDRLPPDERIVFALRLIDGMQLTEIADRTGTSLATVKRRLTKARRRFDRYAGRDPVLSDWQTGDA
ncbi:MAG: sigma-70 family RNA polymerase sigma factor [Nannocystaceae bacterium]|nr:sigma-70 family RNA polymerase sigma factor [Nannocystaceae bacterium]